MKKSFSEKFGDMLDHLGKRMLFGLAVAIIGTFCAFLLPIPIINAALLIAALIGIYITLSVISDTKAFFVTNISVTTPSGEVIPCAIVKRNHHAYMPIIPFFCIFFYIPYKTQYCLIENLSASNIEPNTRVYDSFLTYRLVNVKELTKAEFNAIIANPQSIAENISERVANRRAEFCEDIKHLTNADLVTEIYCTNQLSVCKIGDDYVLFLYSKYNNHHFGISIKESFIDEIKNDASVILPLYMAIDDVSNHIISTDTGYFERHLRNSENQNEEAVQKVYEKINENKTILTKEIIAKKLKGKNVTLKRFCGFWLCYFSIGGFCASILCAMTGLFIVTPFLLPLSCFGFYRGVKTFKKGSKNKIAIYSGNYRIVKTHLTQIEDRSVSDSDGTLSSFVSVFENGESITRDLPLGNEGDVFYMVYLSDNEKVSAYFNGLAYLPSPDLKIDE